MIETNKQRRNLLAVLPALVLASTPLLASDEITVFGSYDMEGTTLDSRERYFRDGTPVAPVVKTLPLDERQSTWEEPGPFGGEPHGMWVYANEEGRVRTHVRTGSSAINRSQYGKASLVWRKNFSRDNGDDPTFTIYPSVLRVLADSRGPLDLKDSTGRFVWPFAKMSFGVELCSEYTSNLGLEYDNCRPIFEYRGEMNGVAGDATVPLELIEHHTFDHALAPHPYERLDAEKIINTVCVPAIGGPPVCRTFQLGLELNIPKYKGNLYIEQLYGGNIALGDPYQVIYRLDVEAGQDAAEQFAEAILGDPLDTDIGGFSLETTHTPVASSKQFCRQRPDPERFTSNGDGTVTDEQTGLMWQRCPVGYTLDDRGTPADLDDDLCTGSSAIEFDWQQALQAGDADDSAGFSDWRVPNVKELESLVEHSCIAQTIDTTFFPDAPPTPFWSSTPALDGSGAWSVGFSNGESSTRDKTSAELLRLVRDSGDDPVAPRPTVTVSDARVDEGDDGTASMRFLVVLSQALTDDLSVDYATTGMDAEDGIDFTPVTGSIVIPAGERYGFIDVPVTGDTDPEIDESLLLAIENMPAGVHLADPIGIGTIVNDEPMASVVAAIPDRPEGDAGSQSFEFRIVLDKPAAAAFDINYETIDGTAVAGSDYAASSGSVTFAPGETEKVLLVDLIGDTTRENDESFTMQISDNASGPLTGTSVAAASASAIIVDDDHERGVLALNDTGVTYCADAGSTLLACPQPDFPQQDGDIGRDVTDDDPADGLAGFSFTKLDSSGIALPVQGDPFSITPWSCVLDETTGLTWETKTDTTGDLRHYDGTYSWFNSSGSNDGGDTGTENGGICSDSGNCDTEKYVAAVNAIALCGYTDWRLPEIDELYTIAVTASPTSSSILGMDRNFFPHNYSTGGSFDRGFTYWSATTSSGVADQAWSIQYRSPDPGLSQAQKFGPASVRLVRGGNN